MRIALACITLADDPTARAARQQVSQVLRLVKDIVGDYGDADVGTK